LALASGFYGRHAEVPGTLLASVGLIDVRFYRMYREIVSGDPQPEDDHVLRGAQFPDATFRADRMTTPAELAAGTAVMDDLLAQVFDGFDLPRLPPGTVLPRS
jgi:hypothetical protein